MVCIVRERGCIFQFRRVCLAHDEGIFYTVRSLLHRRYACNQNYQSLSALLMCSHQFRADCSPHSCVALGPMRFQSVRTDRCATSSTIHLVDLATPLPNIAFRTRLLRRKFVERFTSPDARSDVNYVAFLAAVDMAAAGHDEVRPRLRPSEFSELRDRCSKCVSDSIDRIRSPFPSC